MADLSDIQNEFIQAQIKEFIERPEERREIVNLYVKIAPELQEIAANIIRGDHIQVDQMTAAQLEAGTTALTLIIFITGQLYLVPTVVLIALCVFYLWASSRQSSEEPDLMGLARLIGAIPA